MTNYITSEPTPPLNGIARKRRSDAGIPRRSTLDALYDMFADLTPEAQKGVLEILGVIHRQALRARCSDAAADV